MKWHKLKENVERDSLGVPVGWTLLRAGDNELCQEGVDGVLHIDPAEMRSIVDYFNKKGELIPIDSEHYLYELAERKKIDEGEALKLFPDGTAALGFGTLELDGDDLRIKVKWSPTAYEFLKDGIYKYFSPVVRGLKQGPLRVTSVAMTNTPAINNLDALAARSETRKVAMSKLNEALKRLLGRDDVALGADCKPEDQDKLACEVEEKANLIDQIKTLLGLEAGAGIDEIIAALKAETEKAKTADEKQAALDELAASAEKKAHGDLITQGRNAGKITDADMEYVNSLDSKALSAYLAHTSVKVPLKRTAPACRKDEPAALSCADHTALSALRHLGITEEEYLKAKTERNSK